MLGTILAFIKAHLVATVITTTVVVTTAVATPIVIDNYNLNKSVEANIGMLEQNEKPTTDTTEPLTFRIEKVITSSEGGNIVKNMQGEDAIELSSTMTGYKIIPSYNKDISEWTKDEKEEYERVVAEANAMAKADYDNAVASEEKNLEEVWAELQKEQTSYSKKYIFPCHTMSFQYNSYTNKYYCDWYPNYVSEVTVEEFKNIVAPAIRKQIELYVDSESRQKGYNMLNELLSLSQQ